MINPRKMHKQPHRLITLLLPERHTNSINRKDVIQQVVASFLCQSIHSLSHFLGQPFNPLLHQPPSVMSLYILQKGHTDQNSWVVDHEDFAFLDLSRGYQPFALTWDIDHLVTVELDNVLVGLGGDGVIAKEVGGEFRRGDNADAVVGVKG